LRARCFMASNLPVERRAVVPTSRNYLIPNSSIHSNDCRRRRRSFAPTIVRRCDYSTIRSGERDRHTQHHRHDLGRHHGRLRIRPGEAGNVVQRAPPCDHEEFCTLIEPTRQNGSADEARKPPERRRGFLAKMSDVIQRLVWSSQTAPLPRYHADLAVGTALGWCPMSQLSGALLSVTKNPRPLQ
jgi:hypothetical protein